MSGADAGHVRSLRQLVPPAARDDTVPTRGHTAADEASLQRRPDAAYVQPNADERVRGHPARLAGAHAKRSRDPAAMAPEDRLAELAGILAAGYRRMRLSREKALAESGGAERSCDLVDSPENEDAPEVA